jgi:hypothetical protein
MGVSRSERFLYRVIAVTVCAGGAHAVAEPLFAPNELVPVGMEPQSIVAGDFDGNGHADFAVTARGSDAVSVVLGNGDGTFAPEVRYGVGLSPRSIATADLNGDGLRDLAVVNHDSGDVSVLLGLGDGSFAAETRFAVGANPDSVAVGDFDGDRQHDLAVPNFSSGGISILSGNGDGTFAPQVLVEVGQFAVALAAGDLDGDLRQDLAVTKNTDEVGILLGNGDGSFGLPAFFPVGEQPSTIEIGDFDEDGRSDLAVAVQGDGTVTVFLGDGDGTFGPGAPYGDFGGFTGPWSVAIDDVDADGHQDLIAPNRGIHDVRVLLGAGDGTFGDEIIFPGETNALPVSVALADFDGDGVLDVAVANEGTHNVSTRLGRGDGTFGPRSFPTGGLPLSVGVGDFDEDGAPDVVVPDLVPDEISLLFGDGSGGFAPEVPLAAGLFPWWVEVADLDGDGYDDIAVANDDSVSVLLGSGDGTFEPEMRLLAGVFPLAIVAMDLNDDTVLDLAVTNLGSNDVSVLLGAGDGTFLAESRYPAGEGPGTLAVADFDGDDVPDLAVASTATDEIALLLGVGDGSFAPETRLGVGPEPFSIATGDFDRDGTPDLVAANEASDDVSVLLGQGDGNFVETARLAVGDLPRSLTVADLDGDTVADLAVVNRLSDDLSVLIGDGSGGFATEARFGAIRVGYAVAAADLDGDGRRDLVFAARDADSGAVLVLLNEGAVANLPPLSDAGSDREVECASPAGSAVTLDGSASSDPDSSPGSNDGIVTFAWFEDFGLPTEMPLGTGETLEVTLDLGAHAVTLVVTDAGGLTDSDDVTVTVVDSTPPTLSIELAPAVLWPPNHRMVDVTAAVTTSDVCGGTQVSLESVTSSEPDNGPGDGNTSDDIQDASTGTPDLGFRLRAERAASGDGRRYAVTYAASDDSGNTTLNEAFVDVPHDQAGTIDPLAIELEEGAAGTRIRWTPVDGAEGYDAIRGRLSDLREAGPVIDLGDVVCIEAHSEDASTANREDARIPAPGAAFFYLVEYEDATGPSHYGTESADKPRSPATGNCP